MWQIIEQQNITEHCLVLDEELQTVNWPVGSGTYRVAQLYVGETPYLRFSQGNSGHPGIMWRLAEELGMKLNSPPALRTERYTVAGMGIADIDAENRRAVFHGGSTEYMLVVSSAHLTSIRPEVPDWTLTLRNT